MTNNDVWSLGSRNVRSHRDITYFFSRRSKKGYVISRCDLTFLLSKLHTSLFVIFFHPNILPKNIWHFVTKERKKCSTGQLISKCLFGVFTFFQKTNKIESASSKVEFVRSFFGSNAGLKKSFRICLTCRDPEKLLKRLRICKSFEITRTICSNSERSEQLLVTECFLNLFL